jgi:hypothetical protein
LEEKFGWSPLFLEFCIEVPSEFFVIALIHPVSTKLAKKCMKKVSHNRKDKYLQKTTKSDKKCMEKRHSKDKYLQKSHKS